MHRPTSYFLFFTCFSICYSLKTNGFTVKEYNESRKENIRNCLEKVVKIVSKSDEMKLYRNCFKNKAVNKQRTKSTDSDEVSSVKQINSTKNNKQLSENVTNPEIQTFVDKSDLVSSKTKTDLIVFNFGDVLKIGLFQNSTNGDILVKINFDENTKDMARGKTGLTGSNTQLLSYALVPALMLAGIMPWVMPGLQVAVSVVAIVNQMIFSSSLVTLIRSYIFDSRPEEHVVYVNHGYKNIKNHHHPRGYKD